MSTRILPVLLGIALLFPVVSTGQAYAMDNAPENVFLVIIDGLRAQEGFDDTTHQYIPHMWNDLRPLGTLYTNVRVSSKSETFASHCGMAYGVRDFRPIHATDFNHNWRGSSYYPNIFEMTRKELNLPAEKVQIIGGFGGISQFHHNFHPAYGEDTWPIYIGLTWWDIGRYNELLSIMETDQPALIMINFHEVDMLGHSGSWEAYLLSIQQADLIVYDLWTKIQMSDHYKNKTALIIVTDHGRHSDNVREGFRHHSCDCTGCQRVFILGLGPGIKSNLAVDTYVDLIDICATIGDLIGVDTPFAMGKPLGEMLELDRPASKLVSTPLRVADCRERNGSRLRLNLSCSEGYSRNPSIAVNDDAIYVAWLEEGEGWDWDAHIVSSIDGNLWQDEAILVSDSLMYDDIAISAPSGGHGPNISLMGLVPRPVDGSFKWYNIDFPLDHRHESEWISTLKCGIFPRACRLAAAAEGERSMLAWSAQHLLLDFDVDFADAYVMIRDGITTDYNVAETSYKVTDRSIDVACSGEYIYLLRSTGREMHFQRSTDSGLSWEDIGSLSTPRMSPMQGKLACSDNFLTAVWAELNDDRWEIRYRVSTDYGETWSVKGIVSQPSSGAWKPDVVMDGTGGICVAWEDHRTGGGNSEIYARKSLDYGATWTSEKRLTNSPGYWCDPQLSMRNGIPYIVWQKYLDGQWDIFFMMM